MQEVLFVTTAYFPIAHSVQVADVEAPAAAEYVPTGQLRQVVLDGEPRASEYFPAAHAMHDAPDDERSNPL